MNAGLGNGDGLLFHNLMDSGTIVGAHLIELINADDTAVGENHSTGLEAALLGEGVSGNGGGETDTGGTATRGRDGVGRDVHAEAEQLRLTARGITDHQDVGVTTKAGAVAELLHNTTGEHEDKTLLNPVVAPDVRGERTAEDVHGVVAGGDLLELLDVITGPFTLLNGSVNIAGVVGNNAGGEDTGSGGLGWLGHRAVDTENFDAVTGLDGIAQILLDDDVAVTGHLTGRGLLGELLKDELLRVAVLAETDIGFDRVAFLILGGHLAGGGLLGKKGGSITVGASVHFTGLGAVVSGDGELGDDLVHLGDDALNANGLVNEGGGKATHGNVVTTMSAGKAYSDLTLNALLVILGIKVRNALIQGFLSAGDVVGGLVKKILNGLRAPLLNIRKIEDETRTTVGPTTKFLNFGEKNLISG